MLTRRQVLGFRMRAQQLDRDSGTIDDTAVLDLGVQDTGTDGARWALMLRGVEHPSADDLATVWTLRGAPHVYRRADLPAIATATAPFSDADAGKRIFDAAKPLKAAGISNLTALDTVADAMRSIVTAPMVKGEMSTRLTAMMDPPHLRFCRPCNATHVYEQPFRLSALRAGLELEAGTSPPVIRPIPGFRPAATVPDRFDVVRAYLRLLGPAPPKHVARHLDAPVHDAPGRRTAEAGRGLSGPPGKGGAGPRPGRRRGGDCRGRPALPPPRRRRAAGRRPAGGHPPAGPLRPLPAGPRPVPARRGPGPGQGPLAHPRPSRRRPVRRRDRRHLAGPEGRRGGDRLRQAVATGGPGRDHRPGAATGRLPGPAPLRGGDRRLRTASVCVLHRDRAPCSTAIEHAPPQPNC